MKLISLFFLLLLATSSHAQARYKTFVELFEKNDTTGQLKLIEQWEQAAPGDPELYVAQFNYYANRSRMEVVVIKDEPVGEEQLEMKDSLGRTFYMGSEIKYEESILRKAFGYIDKGIAANPDRLDMRLGKITMLGRSEHFEEYVQEIVKMAAYSLNNKHAWLWTNGIPGEYDENAFFEAIQNCVMKLYERDDQLGNMGKVAEGILQYYPNHVPTLSNAAISYLMTKNYSKALEYLAKAEKLAPEDCVVLNNIAHTYVQQGNLENAIAYYEKMFKYGTEDDQQYAKEKIEELKRK
jgi:tetratricopeptide (TPR) repeat protein